MKHIYLLFVWPACFCYTLCAQVKDDFSDNDFDNRPMWTGNDENFEITTGELHLVAPAETAESYLSTANGLVKNTTWEFYFRFEQNPSGSNKAFVYLVSDQAELQRSLNGYYVLIGNSSDEISLYRQDGTKSTELIDGVDDVVDSNPVNVRVRVTRDSIGNWELLRDATGGTNYSSEGTAFDATYTSTSYFGINCDYTSTRSTLFYFDDFKISAPLQIDTVQIIANDSIHVQFNTPVANNEQVSNYEITGSSDTISIGFVKRSIVDSSLVQIRLNEPLLSDSYQLTIGGIEEVIEETFHDFSIDFAYKALALVSKEVLSDSSLILTFNDSLNTIQTDNFFIDQSIGNPVSTQLQNSDSAQVVLIFDQKFEDGIEYLLTISEVENLLENSSFSGTSEIEFVLPLIPENAVALIKNTLRVDFNKKLDKTTTETNEHYFLDGVNPVGAALQANDSSVLLTFENAFNSGPFSLEINGLKDNRGNVMTPASVGFEYLELLVLQTEQVGDSINVKFNQLLDLVSAMNHGNYSVLGTNPVSVSHKSDSTVSLLFPHLVNNRYELIIDGVDNRSGNATAESLTFDFFFETLTSSRTIVFNEIMADPNPSVALPIAEYIELYNASNTSINLRNFTMNEATLPDSSISAKSYALVIDDSNIEDFRDFENLIVVSNFGALNNGGEPLVLRDQFGNTVDSLHYNIHWYDDVEKASGGYALEQINPHLPCPDDFNWTASLHEIGGTPGLQNSLFDTIPDTMSPELTDFQVIGGNLIKLSFSESIDASSMTIGAFALPQNSIVAVDQTSFSTVELFLAQDLVSEVFHDLSLSGLHDCSGNEMMDLTIHFYHDLLTPSLLGLEIVSDSEITLVFSEPLSESVAEDEKHYNLGSIQPLKAILQDSATQKVVLSFDTLFLENEIYEVNLVGIQDTMGNATDTLQSAFVYLDHVKGTQVVAENLMTIFFKEMIAESTIGPQNFLLEEIGRPDQIVLDSKDQSVVRLSFSENIDDNTAYRLFMRKILNTHGDSLITPAAHVFWDTKGPVPDELLLLSDRALEINFNEPLRPEVAINVLNYQRSDGEQPIEAVLTDPSSVKLIFDTPFEVEMEQTLTVKNLQDVLGNKMTSARTMSFLYDPLPPTLDSAFVLAPDQVQVQFSEPLLQNALVNENFKINDKNPTNIRLLGPDSTTIVLGFSEEFPEVLLPYKLEYLEDRNGNEITNPITGEINYVNAVLSRIQLLTPEIVQLTFNRAMETAAVDRLNYQLSDIYIDTVKQVDERTFQLVLAKSLAFQTDYDLELGDILDLGGQSLLHHRYTFTFEPYFTSLEVIDDRTLELLFSTSFTSLASTAFAIDDQSPQFLSIDPENRGKVRLVFEEPFAANKNLTLSWQLLTDRYGRVVPSYGYSFLLDDQPPYLSHIESDFFNTVKIVFNETIDPSTALSVSQYEILEQGNPSRVDQEGNTSFLLVFDSLVIGMEYTIQVKNISDESGNFLESDSLTFIYQPPVVPEAGSVIVTEIMADPSPSVGLPEAEYVELHNTTSDTINLRSMMMTDGMAVLALPNAQLAPEGYYVISGDKLFNLGNDGDSVVLTDVYGHLIDRVVYTRDWYRDTEKDDGGYSLELINPSSPCGGQANWIASGAESGGTPGYQNSVFNLDPDGVSPFVVGHHLIGTDQLLVNFNETIDTTTIHLSGFLSDLLIENFSFSEDEVILTFRDDLKNGELLHLTISGVKDCAGNVIEETTLSFGLGKKPAYNELLITEIMADPEPVVGLPSIEYLEIYNASDFLISLEQVRIADEGSTSGFIGGVLSAGEYLLLTPSSAVDFFETNNVMGISNWVSLNNDGELLQLIHDNGVDEELVFYLSYHHDWHTSIDAQEGGFSLEMKDVANPCAGQVNWTTSKDLDGGTPGRENSVKVSVPDNFPPSVLSFEGSSNQLTLQFDEILDFRNLPTLNVEPETGIHNVSWSVQEPQELSVEVSELVANADYMLIVSGAEDCLGNRTESQELKFVLPVEASADQLKISEVLFDPRPDEADFIEVFNDSDQYLDLRGFVISNEKEGFVVSNTSLNIPPRSFRVFTENVSDLQHAFPQSVREALVSVDRLPSMPNDQGVVRLINQSGLVIDSLPYEEDFHSILLDDTEGVSIERISYASPTYDRNNWHSASASVGFATPGYHNSQALESQASSKLVVEPKVFVPGSATAGAKSFTTVNYQFEEPGLFANIFIYNQNGQQVRQLAHGTSLATKGFIQWDGTDDSGSPVRLGYYIIAMEVWSSSGKRELLKESVVVGAEF